MVPICRDTGSVIAFGGRRWTRTRAAEVPEFARDADLLEGPDALRPEPDQRRRSASVGFAVLVEGYFDFAQVFQTQAAPVVASCGTALTPQQAQLLRRFTTKSGAQLRPGRGRPGRGRPIVRAAGRRRVRRQRGGAGQGRGSRYVHPAAGRRPYRERLRASRPYLEYLLDQAAAGLDFGQDDSRRQFLGKMLTVAARIPEPPPGISSPTGSPTRRRLPKRSSGRRFARPPSQRQTERHRAGSCPRFGQLKNAEKGLIWGLIHNTERGARGAVEPSKRTIFEPLAGREVFEVARSLHNEPPDRLPSTLFQRLSTVNAQLVTSIAARPARRPRRSDCVRALKTAAVRARARRHSARNRPAPRNWAPAQTRTRD